jgi:hypothetical protein
MQLFVLDITCSSKINVFKILTALSVKLYVLLSVEPTMTLSVLFKTWDNEYRHFAQNHHAFTQY